MSFERGLIGFILLQALQIFEEEQPGGLLGVIEIRGATGLLPEKIVYVFEGLPNMVGSLRL